VVNALLVAAGGALGAMLRYLLDSGVERLAGPGFPWGTFVINVTGCFLIGVVLNLVERGVLSARARLFFAVGILGGYTTFSIFSYESLQLISAGEPGGYALYAFGQLALGMVAVYLGVVLARRLGGV
jgi:CrcB protein